MTPHALQDPPAASRPDLERTYVRYIRAGGVGELVLDRAPLNILHVPMLEELDAVLGSIEHDPSLKLLLLTGTGTAFCAGADVADHLPGAAERMLGLFRSVIRRLLAMECPTVAAVHGATLGAGCELMMACDLTIAAENARIGQPEIKLGVLPPVAAALLPRLVGRQRAMDLVLTGRTLTAHEAHAMGLVAEVSPTPTLRGAVDAYVERLAGYSGPVLRLAKKAVLEAGALPPVSALLRAEEIYLEQLMRLHDPEEGLRAFLEKRRPVWKEA